MLYSQDAGGAVFKPKPSPSPSPTPTASSTPFQPAPTPPPAGSVQTAPGYSPDYGSLIQNDPAYLQAQSAANLARNQAGAQRKAALQAALIRYGGALPSGFTDQYGDIDQATLDAAKQNQNSILVQLSNNYTQSQDQFRRGLAARGALQSGDLAYGQDQLDKGYAQQQYDAANSFGNEAQNAIAAYTGVLQGNAQNLSQAIQGAEANVYSNPAYRPSAPQTANYDAANSAAYGQPVYADGQGNLFDQNGNPFNPSAQAAASPYTAPSSGPTSLYQNNAALYGWL